MNKPYLIPKHELEQINECKTILDSIENLIRLDASELLITDLLKANADKLNNMPQYRYEEFTRAERIQLLMMKYKIQ